MSREVKYTCDMCGESETDDVNFLQCVKISCVAYNFAPLTIEACKPCLERIGLIKVWDEKRNLIPPPETLTPGEQLEELIQSIVTETVEGME